MAISLQVWDKPLTIMGVSLDSIDTTNFCSQNATLLDTNTYFSRDQSTYVEEVSFQNVTYGI